jgi:hypothetical protein
MRAVTLQVVSRIKRAWNSQLKCLLVGGTPEVGGGCDPSVGLKLLLASPPSTTTVDPHMKPLAREAGYRRHAGHIFVTAPTPHWCIAFDEFAFFPGVASVILDGK